jgi:hypothetical protein
MNGGELTVGSGGNQLIEGVGPHAVKTGYCARSATSWADNTQIKSITPCDASGDAMTAVTAESWESKVINDSKYVSFADPIAGYNAIVSITLNAEGDKMMLWLEPLPKDND